mgnify:FL=1
MAILPVAIEPLEVLSDNNDQDTKFAPVPAGSYTLVVRRSSVEQTRKYDSVANIGHRLSVGFTIEGGAYDGRWIWVNYNVTNSNPAAQAAGLRQVANLSKACGHNQTVSDSSVLHDKRFTAQVAIEAGTNGYEDKNTIVSYKQVSSNGPVVTTPWANRDQAIPF